MFDNKLWTVFVANNNSNELLVCSSSDGQNWSSSTEVQQYSKAAPALAVFDNKLWTVFVANNNSNELLSLQFQRWPELELQHPGPAVEQGRPRHLWPGYSNTQPDDLARA